MIDLRLWQLAGWTMLHYLWVGAAMGAVALLMRQRLCSASANVRYLAALGSLLLLTVAPAAIALIVAGQLGPAESGVPQAADAVGQAQAPTGELGRPAMPPAQATVSAAASPAPEPQEQWLPAALDLLAAWLPWLWLFGAPLSFALTTTGLLGAERLRRESRPLEDAGISDLCRLLAASLRISCRVGVAVCDRIAAPILVGVLRPMILLPAAALSGWDPQQLEMVLLHELAHVRRCDNLVNLLQRVVESLLFFQPMVWIVSGWVRREREHCCDELVVAHTQRPRAYAELLVALAEKLPPRSLLAHTVGWDKRSEVPPALVQALSSMAERPVLARVRQILKKEEQAMQVSRRTVGLVLVGLSVVAVVVGRYHALPSRAEEPGEKTSRQSSAAKPARASDVSKPSPGAILIAVAASAKPAAPEATEPAAETPAATPPQEKKAIRALTYTGRVTDKLTGKPIAGATVTVRREILAPYELRLLEEPKYTTDASGRYTFTIPPEQVAERFLYIELDVSHPDYAPRRGFGYALSMIRKNEPLGMRPFFEHVDLYPAAPVAGAVVKADGKPAAAVKVLGFSMPDRRDFESASFSEATTDANGAFRLNVTKGSRAIFWILPKDAAPSAHLVDEKRGDLGRFTLEKGIVLTGRVRDEHDKPVAGVWVNAEITGGPAKKVSGLPVADFLARAALTDGEGRFRLAPLPAGDCLVRVADYPHDGLLRNQGHRPPPGVFAPQRLTLTANEATVLVALRAVPQVVIEGQFFDSRGKTRLGHAPMLWGHLDLESSVGQSWADLLFKPSGDAKQKNPNDPRSFYSADGAMDKNGHFMIRAPKGLKDAKLNLMTNEHSALRVRMTKDGPLSNQHRDIDLGTLQHDVRGIEVVRYEAPILLVKPVAEKGGPLGDAKVNLEYGVGKGPWKGAGRFTEGKDIHFEKQNDGRWRSEQLLPDEDFTVTVEAPGYQPNRQQFTLPEGVTKDVEVKLKRAAAKANETPQKTSGQTPPGAAPAAAQPEMVVDVKVQGNKTLPLTKILPHIRTRVGRPFDMDLLTEDVRRLDHTHLFVDVKTYTQKAVGGWIVVFDLLERPLVQEVNFIGNKEIDRRTLRKTADVKVGDPADPFAIEEARRRIEEFYHGNGFTGARVTLLEGDKPEDRKAHFLIDEGDEAEGMEDAIHR
jgi:beta-lactamase regulating signal transducer with metallopeptidase domain